MPDSIYNSYLKTYKNPNANAVIRLFNKKVAKKILEGEQFQLMGKIYIEKVFNTSTRLKCLPGATVKARKESGDSSTIVYRENNIYHRIQWSGRFLYNKLYIKFVRRHELDIPKHEKYFSNVPIYNNQ
jgi:hypothetical protein